MRLFFFIFCLFILHPFILHPTAYADEQGVNANHSGQNLENAIADLLETQGFHIDSHSGYEGSKTELTMNYPRLALRHPPYTTLYGGPGRSDFLLKADELKNDVWIETKRMKVSGSIDEKLVHVWLNSLTASPGKHVIIILEGEGWRPGALKWIRAAQRDKRWNDFANYKNKKVEIMDYLTFREWVLKMFPPATP